MGQSGSFTLLLKRPDSLLLRLTGPFGLKLGTAFVTRREFQFYNSLKNQLISGPTNPENLSRILRVRMTFDDLTSLMTGGIFFPDDRRPPDETAVQEEQIVLMYHDTSGSRQYWIDPESLLIARIDHLDGGGKLTLEQQFSDFQTFQGTAVPRRIRLTQPRERRMVALNYSDLLLNTGPLEFTFSYPSTAEHIRW
jgi:outer membrane lipoprotein-sorting protein